MENKLLILFMGPSGSGKGTQAKMIGEKFDFNYIEMGGILRSEVKKQTDLGKKIDVIIHKEGKLVPDEMVKELIKKALLENDHGKTIVLDGYPRTSQQVFDLDEILKDMEINKKIVVFNIQISDEEAMKRLTQRRICVDCKNVLPADSKNLNCPKCGGKLEHRSDDNPEKIKERLKWAHEKVQPAILEYKKRGVLQEINGERPIQVVHEDIKNKLQKILNSEF
ncbi:MAG: nucleoside monophosphate kinase [Patescibacteria group bacterium]|nr:nucleoside monophosphate kinase [Patescibacteria group bacterium]